MATTTTVYVVTVEQGVSDYNEVQVVTSFITKEAAHEFIASLEKIVDAGQAAMQYTSRSEDRAACRRMLKNLVSIHPRAIINKRVGYHVYNCEECELKIENPISDMTRRRIHIVTVVQGNVEFGIRQTCCDSPAISHS